MQKSPKIKLSILALAAVLGTSVLATHQTYAEATPAVQAASEQSADPIKDYDKIGALGAAVSSALEQVPELSIYYNMYYGAQEVQGVRYYTGVDPTGTIAKGSSLSPEHEELRTQAIANSLAFNPDNTYGQNISAAKTAISSGVVTSPAFKEATDRAEGEYNHGADILRTNLPLVDPTLTDLDTKTGDELLAIYKELPAVKNHTYDNMIEDIEIANSIIDAYTDGTIDKDTLIELATKTYEDFVNSAKTIDPNFKVDLSGVEKITPSKKAPTAPNSGDTRDSELSATIVSIAVASIAAVASISGIAVVAKRYFFSPLKRRK